MMSTTSPEISRSTGIVRIFFPRSVSQKWIFSHCQTNSFCLRVRKNSTLISSVGGEISYLYYIWWIWLYNLNSCEPLIRVNSKCNSKSFDGHDWRKHCSHSSVTVKQQIVITVLQLVFTPQRIETKKRNCSIPAPFLFTLTHHHNCKHEVRLRKDSAMMFQTHEKD